jgi:hypothetical protein
MGKGNRAVICMMEGKEMAIWSWKRFLNFEKCHWKREREGVFDRIISSKLKGIRGNKNQNLNLSIINVIKMKKVWSFDQEQPRYRHWWKVIEMIQTSIIDQISLWKAA